LQEEIVVVKKEKEEVSMSAVEITAPALAEPGSNVVPQGSLSSPTTSRKI
jgi:hypothetical protein